MSFPELNLNELASLTQELMVKSRLIDSSKSIELKPHHTVNIRGRTCSHYIVSCKASNKRFFLKTRKENDTSFHCEAFLRSFALSNGYYPYQITAMPQFDYKGYQYNLYFFVEGETLEELQLILSHEEWCQIANQLRKRIDEISSIHAEQYSDGNEFISDKYDVIQTRKLLPKLRHPAFSDIPSDVIERVQLNYAAILANSSFSIPTLLHMDIKPANIVYNRQSGLLSLIDFELSRFGDIDYGWAQVLLTSLKPYGDMYKSEIITEITKDRISLKEAFMIPKFQCYLLYQTACNLVYYFEKSASFPKEMYSLFLKLLAQLQSF